MIKNIVIIIGDITRSAGTERAVTNLSNMLTVYDEYSVTIISLYSQMDSKCYFKLDKSVEVIHFGLNKDTFFKRIQSYIEYIKQTKKIIKSKNIDIIIGTTHAFNSLMIFMGRKVKKVACEHMNYDACPRISRIIRKFCYKKIDRLVLLTKADSTHYSFLDSSKVFVIPNTLSFTCETPATLENKRIITVGRLSEQKGYDLLIESAKRISREVPDWHIDIFGDGEDKENLSNQIKEDTLSDFITIYSPTKNIKEELLNSGIYVMSSRHEGLPMVLLESKACGLPIVSFNCPEGPKDVIEDGEDGYLVPPLNIDELAKKVVSLCKNDELRKKMGKVSYENSKKYLPENIFYLWDDCFKSIE